MGDAIILIGASILRSIVGWLNNSLQDYSYAEHKMKFWKAIQPYEIDKGLKGIGRTLMIVLAAYFGLNADVTTEAGIGVLIDIGLSEYNKSKSGKR